jgi:broad specificity phosphatase PhoE
MVWEESQIDATTRYIFRWVEISKLQQSPEFKDLVIISVGHGICTTAQRYLAKDKSITAGDYCCIQNISITPNPETKNGGEEYNFEFPVVNHYAYKRNSTGGKIWFVRHSQHTDKNDRPLFEKHLQNGFSGTDSCLTPKGKEMSQQTGEYLKAHKPPQIQKYLIITSPYYRCIETVVGITAGLGPDLLHTNSIYIEDAFEEWASPVAHIKKTTQTKRAYPPNILSDPTLKEQTIGPGLTHMHNTLLNYSMLVTPIRVTFPQRYDHVQSRFQHSSLELIKIYAKGEYNVCCQ